MIILAPGVLHRVAVGSPAGLGLAVRAVAVLGLYRTCPVGLREHAAQRVRDQGAVARGAVARQHFVDLQPGEVGGANGAALQFGDGLVAVVQVLHGLAVDGFFYPAAQGVVFETGCAARAADAGQLVSCVPGVGHYPGRGLALDQVAVGVVGEHAVDGVVGIGEAGEAVGGDGSALFDLVRARHRCLVFP